MGKGLSTTKYRCAATIRVDIGWVLRQTRGVRPEALQGVVLAVAQERQVAQVLDRVVRLVAGQEGVALARLWLVGEGDVCATCLMRPECPEQRRCLHLAASAGTPRQTTDDWTRLDGAFRRFPLGVHKIGKVGDSGSGLLLHDMSAGSSWIAHPEWALREGVRSFAAQPLVVRGETLGVLAVFSRARIDSAAFAWLRALADHAAVAIANARAMEESERLRMRLAVENAYLRDDLQGRAGSRGFVGTSPPVETLLQQIELIAPTDTAVLILGESGTGKELVAHRVHARSRRADRAFIRVDCAGFSPERLEGELFGHGGDLTSALADRAGRLAAADGGTLFLDEVGALGQGLQAKVLRVLQEGCFAPVGDAQTRRVDVRLLAATNRDLRVEVTAGRFREDLYRRLSIFPLVVPALRDRAEDVAPLVEHFVQQACTRLGRAPLTASSRDIRLLARHPWPGNVRELQSVVDRAVLVAKDDRLRFELPPTQAASAPSDEVVTKAEWQRRERANLEGALARTNGRIYGQGGAADLLGVPPTTLASRAKALGIKRPTS